MLHRVGEGGPVTYPLFGGEGAADFLAPFLPQDVCVGGPEQQLDELSIAAQATQSIQIAADASFAAQMPDEEYGIALELFRRRCLRQIQGLHSIRCPAW